LQMGDGDGEGEQIFKNFWATYKKIFD
jgi:hypothetical protein